MIDIQLIFLGTSIHNPICINEFTDMDSNDGVTGGDSTAVGH